MCRPRLLFSFNSSFGTVSSKMADSTINRTHKETYRICGLPDISLATHNIKDKNVIQLQKQPTCLKRGYRVYPWTNNNTQTEFEPEGTAIMGLARQRSMHTYRSPLEEIKKGSLQKSLIQKGVSFVGPSPKMFSGQEYRENTMDC